MRKRATVTWIRDFKSEVFRGGEGESVGGCRSRRVGRSVEVFFNWSSGRLEITDWRLCVCSSSPVAMLAKRRRIIPSGHDLDLKTLDTAHNIPGNESLKQIELYLHTYIVVL